jgi:PEGA domain
MGKKKRNSVLIVILADILLAASCGMMITGEGTQRIPITSVPMGATVIVNGVEQGRTPLILDLAKKARGRVIRIEVPGYQPLEIRLAKKASGGPFFANLLLGLLPGCVPATAYSLAHDGKGFFPVWLLSAAAFGGVFTAVDLASGAVGEFVPKEVTVRLKKADGTPRVVTIFLDADEFRNIKWIRVQRN